jgi:hypothetical protein
MRLLIAQLLELGRNMKNQNPSNTALNSTLYA